MAIRDDIIVDFEQDPRLAAIAAPSEELSAQDSHDTLVNIQETPEGMNFPGLVESAGKEDLGGGVSVGITTTGQNVQFYFERTGSIVAGTVTSTSISKLIDSGATFIAAGVARGDWIINFTDQSVAEVLTVDSEIQLSIRPLSDGTDDTFTSGDLYKVWDVREATLEGGNFVAVDEFGTTINPIFPTFGRTFTRTSASSATATSQKALEFASFQGGVAWDSLSPYTLASSVPGVLGSREFPLGNVADVQALAIAKGINQVFVMSDATAAAVDFSTSPVRFVGDSPFVTLTLDPSADITGCACASLTLSGELDGLNTVRDCLLDNVTNCSGVFDKCAFNEDVTLSGDVSLFSCYAQGVGLDFPKITVGAHNTQVRDWHGGLGLVGVTGGTHIIEVYGGQFNLDNTCTGGGVYLRGEYSLPPDDQSVGTTLIDQTNTNKDLHIAKAVLANRVDISADGATVSIYDDDGVTVLWTNNVSANKRFRTVA